MKYKASHVAEYVLLQSITGLVKALPHRAALAVGWFFARVAYCFMGAKIKTVKARIRQVLGQELPERNVRRIAWLAWLSLAFNAIEMMRTPIITLDWIKTHVEHKAIYPFLDHIRQGRGAVLAVPHMGNWELAGVGAQLFGARIMIIVRRQKNLLTDALMNRMREHTGIDAFYTRSKELLEIPERMKKGQVLAILPDLRAKTDEVRVQFLGHEADIPSGMARFAREAGVPIIPAAAIRTGWTRHRWESFEPIEPDPNLDEASDIRRMTQHVMNAFDRAIREHPEQYFWYNKRWVLGDD